MAAHPAPEQAAVAPCHDALVPIGIGLSQLVDAAVADIYELFIRGIENGEKLVAQIAARIAEHRREGVVAVADAAVLGHHKPDGRMNKGKLFKAPLRKAIVGTYFHHLAPFNSISDAETAS